MSKTSIYKKPDYCLSYGTDDVVFLDIEIKIIRTEVVPVEQFQLEIVSCAINAKQMEFVAYLVEKLDTAVLTQLNLHLRELLKNELAEELYHLYYVGEIQE